MPCREPLADGRYYWRAFCGDDKGFWTPAANYRRFLVSQEDRDEIIARPAPAHPKLLLSAGETDGLRDRILRSEHLRRGWQYQLNAALNALDLDPPDEAYAKAGTGRHGDYMTAAAWYQRHLTNVAFVALVTGNRRLIEKGVEMLLAACSYARWLGPMFDQREHFDPPWHSALETAMMTEAVAMGYDLLYEHLSDRQREAVRQAIVEKGVRVLVQEWADPIGSSRIPRHQVPTGYWAAVCSASAGIGGLAVLGEHPDAAQWVRLVRNRVRAWLTDRGGDWCVDEPRPRNRADPIPVVGPSEPNFGVDGGYKEGISHMNDALRCVCVFADALRRVTDESLFVHVPDNVLDPPAWNVLAWPTEAGLKSGMIDFGDCRPGARCGDLYTAMMKHRRAGRAGWLYRRTVFVPTTPCSLVWYDDTVIESPPDSAVPMAVFRGIGQVVTRSGWSPNTPAAVIKFRQDPGHLDLGTFYLFGGGQPTMIDSGSRRGESSLLREYCSQTPGHNVVLVDDGPQVRAEGTMLAAVSTSRMTAASGELSAAYPQAVGSWIRDLLMLPGPVAIVADRLEGKGQHRFDLVLHPWSPFTVSSPGELVVGEPPGAALITVHSDGTFTTVEQDGYDMAPPGRYVRFNAEAPAEHRSFVTVCRWPTARPTAQATAAVEPAGSGRWRIDQVQGSSRLAVRVGGVSDEWLVTDARLTAVWDPGHPTRRRHAIVLSGKRLAVEGQELLQATQPINAAVEFDLPLRAHIWAARPTRVTLAADERALEIRLNAAEATGRRTRQSITVDIPAGESELVASEFDRPVRRLPPLVADDLPAAKVGDAPAYLPGVITRTSTSWSNALDAVDGDPNTAWISMPHRPMPQWLEVQLPRPEPMNRIVIDTGLPAAGRVETWNVATGSWRPQGRFETTLDYPSRTIRFDRTQAHRVRVVIERIDPSSAAAEIYSLGWDDDASR